jgi:hypothetical protein
MSNEYTRWYERPQYYTQTAHPDIFKCTYWGRHHGTPSDEIINNRARFVKQFEITKISELSSRLERRLFDILYQDKYNHHKNITDISEKHKENMLKDYYLYGNIGLKIVRRDHPEYYLSKKYPGCIIHIFSMHTCEELHSLILEDGYKELYPLYNVDQKTYIKIRPRFKNDYHIIDPFED